MHDFSTFCLLFTRPADLRFWAKDLFSAPTLNFQPSFSSTFLVLDPTHHFPTLIYTLFPKKKVLWSPLQFVEIIFSGYEFRIHY